MRPPLYPLLLGAVYRVFGHDLDVARVTNVVLGTVAVLLLYLLVQRVFDRRLALVAAAIAAVLPTLVFLPGGLLSENLVIPLVLGVALLAHDRRAVSAGLLLGLAVMTRTNALLLALPLVLALRGSGWRQPALALGCVALTLVPWTIRNAAVFDRFLPTGTQSGYTMAGQWNGPASTPGPQRAEWRLPRSVGAFADVTGDEAEIDAELRSRALRFARENPGAVVAALVINLQRTFGVHPGHTSLDGIAYTEMAVPEDRWWVLRWSTYALALLALLGLSRHRLWLYPALLLAGYVVWLGTPRYRVPLDPFLAVLAATALMRLRSRAR